MRLLDLGVEPVDTLLAPKTGRVALSNHDQCPSISHLARPMKVEFDYTRSLGPVLSQFMIGQRRRQGTGSVLSDGTVVVPPPEYDPITYKAVTEIVAVGAEGVVRTWS